MVKGRRVKTVVTSSCGSGRNCESTKRKYVRNTNIIKSPILDHCITDFFKIQCIDHENDSKDCGFKIPSQYEDDLKGNFEKEALLMVVEDNLAKVNETQNVAKVSTPHRIQLNTDDPDSKINQLNKRFVKTDLVKNKLSKKINARLGKEERRPSNDHKLTEYFPIRRSVRKTKRTVLEEKQKNLEQLLRDGIEEGLKIHCFDGKGRGIIAVKSFSRGDFVVEYSGELLDVTEAKIREAKYAEDENTGCYMYYFKYLNQQYCIDATTETGRLGRLVNHSRNGNLVTRTIAVDGYPHLILLAKDDISIGEEISYDYGDRSKESLKNHPWLAF